MRKDLLQIVFLVMAGSAFSSGCINSHRMAVREPVVVIPANPVVVGEAPPAPRQEAVGIAPGDNQVWVSGFWMRSDQRWVWVPGHWETRPRVGSIWVPGEWNKDATGKGWFWTPGHWE